MSITALGQYGGPKANTFGSGDFLMDRVVVINNGFHMVNGVLNAAAQAVRIGSLAVVGNNTFIGDKITAVTVTDIGSASIDAVNNAVYYFTSGSIGTVTDKGGNFATLSAGLALLPDIGSGDYTPSRFAEAGEPFAVNPSIAFPGENVWMYDIKSREVLAGDWTSGCISANFRDTVVAISAGFGPSTDLMAGLGQSVEIGPDGIATFSTEPAQVFFGRGCVLSYESQQYGACLALVDVKADQSGSKWRVTGLDGGLPRPTGTWSRESYAPHQSPCSAHHMIADLNTEMKSDTLAKTLGFRSTGSLVSARIRLDIAIYNCKPYASLDISTAPTTSRRYQIRLYAPSDYALDCVQRQGTYWTQSKQAGSGFKNSTVLLRRPLVAMPHGVHVVFQNLRFVQVPYQTGDAISNTAGIVSNSGTPLDIDILNCVFEKVSYVADHGSGIAANNMIYSSRYGLKSFGSTVFAHNTVLQAAVMAMSCDTISNGFYAVNNACIANTGANCIVGNSNCYYLANTCSDASGTDRHGMPAPASSLAEMLTGINDYRPKSRSILWENKAVLSHHARRQDSDDSRHRFTAQPSAYVEVTPVPATAMPGLDAIIAATSIDLTGSPRLGYQSYCGAMDYHAVEKHYSVGVYPTNVFSGTISFLGEATPGNGELFQETLLFRISDSTVSNLDLLYPGLLIRSLTSSGSTVTIQVSHRVTDTIWAASSAASTLDSNISSIACNATTLVALSATTGPEALLTIVGSQVGSGLDSSVHVYGEHVVTGQIEYRGVQCTAVNPLRFVGGTIRNTGKALKFIGINGISVEGMTFYGSDSGTAVEFESCAEPAFVGNTCNNEFVAVKKSGPAIASRFTNNIFNKCGSAIQDMWADTNTVINSYTTWRIGIKGSEIELRSWLGDTSAMTPEKLNATQYPVVVTVVQANVSTPTISLPAFSGGRWTCTITMGAAHTWYDLFAATPTDNPYAENGFHGYDNGTGVSICFRVFGQEIIYATYNIGVPTPRNVSSAIYSNDCTAGYFGPDYPADSAYSAIGWSSIISNNSFVRCQTAIDMPTQQQLSKHLSVINNLFAGNAADTPCLLSYPGKYLDNAEPGVADYRPIAAGNASTNHSLSVLTSWSVYASGWMNNSQYVSTGMRVSQGVCLEAMGSAISQHDIDWASPMSYNYGSSPDIESDYDSSFATNRMLQFFVGLGRPEAVSARDIAGRLRGPLAMPGAIDASVKSFGLGTTGDGALAVGEYTSDFSFSGYLVTYYLSYSTQAKHFFDEPGVYDIPLEDGMSFVMGNIDVINKHIEFSRFLREARVLVDAASCPYTIGLATSDLDLETRIAADGLVSDSGASLRYTRTENWFYNKYLPSFQTLKPAFCGCFEASSQVRGFVFSVETNPDQYGSGTAIIMGRGVVMGFDSDKYVIAANSHDYRWFNSAGSELSGEINYTTQYNSNESAKVLFMFSNHGSFIARNIKIAELDNWPYSQNKSTVPYIKGMVDVNWNSRVSIYNCILSYFGSLMIADNGMSGGCLESVTINNNAMTQYDTARQKIGELVNAPSFLSVTTAGAASEVSAMPMWVVSGLNPGDSSEISVTFVTMPMKSNSEQYVKYEINNNDVLVYNAGMAGDAEPTRFEFIQGLDHSDPMASRYSPSVVQHNNRMVHACSQQDNATAFVFGPSVSGYDSKMANTQTTGVHGSVVFGDNTGGNTYITTEYGIEKRIQCIDVDNYFNGMPSYTIDRAAMQKFAASDAKPNVSSSAYIGIGGGYSGGEIWENTDVRSIDSATGKAGPRFDIVGNPRFHRDGKPDIGAYYISYLQTSFGRDNIVDIDQVLISDIGAGLYRITGGNKIFTPVVKSKASDYAVGSKMLIKMRANTSAIDMINYKPMDVVAVFENTLFDDAMMCMLMPQAGAINGVPATGYHLDQVFQGLLSNRYILGYDYTSARATVYKNPLYGVGCTGDFSPVDQARYSENRMTIV